MLPSEQPVQHKTSSRPRRVAALVLGVLILTFVVGVTFIVLKRSGVRLRSQPSSSLNGNASTSGVLTDATALELHNSQDDCWVAIHDVVYDLTSYGPSHPAGSHWIWDSCGTEATADYDRYHKTTRFLTTVSANQVGTYSSGSATSSTTSGSASTTQSPVRSTNRGDDNDEGDDE